jgi:hypothetical protein
MIIRRTLRSESSYVLSDESDQLTRLYVKDSDGDESESILDRAEVRRLIDDLTLIAGLAPTASTLGPAAALAGALRRNFELLAELEKTDPAAADQIAASIAAHLRSWKPMILLQSQSQVTP